MGHGRTDEFRKDAVRIALTSGLTRKQVADDLGVGMSTLNKWITPHRDTDVVSHEDRELALENERLRRENRILREERDILTKATASSHRSFVHRAALQEPQWPGRGHSGPTLSQRMQVQKAENDARSCGNENSATQRFSSQRSFNPVQTGGIQTDHSLRSVSTVETRDKPA
jgi:transposase